VVLRDDGSATLEGEPGTLLGIFEDPDLADSEVELGPGDIMLLYTDGVIEAGRPRGLLGEEGLAKALAAARPATAAAAVHLAESAAIEAQDGPVRDDIALVAVRVRAPVAAPLRTISARG
jgi:serine phosphatase RsbU (regulator of sigma subunit)